MVLLQYGRQYQKKNIKVQCLSSTTAFCTNSKLKRKYSPEVSDNKMDLLEDVKKVESIPYYFSHTPGNQKHRQPWNKVEWSWKYVNMKIKLQILSCRFQSGKWQWLIFLCFKTGHTEFLKLYLLLIYFICTVLSIYPFTFQIPCSLWELSPLL